MTDDLTFINQRPQIYTKMATDFMISSEECAWRRKNRVFVLWLLDYTKVDCYRSPSFCNYSYLDNNGFSSLSLDFVRIIGLKVHLVHAEPACAAVTFVSVLITCLIVVALFQWESGHLLCLFSRWIHFLFCYFFNLFGNDARNFNFVDLITQLINTEPTSNTTIKSAAIQWELL